MLNWLNANKIALSVSKTEPAILSLPKKQLDQELKIKFIGNKLYQTEKYDILNNRLTLGY